MRILLLSDIHLSTTNLDDLKNFYLEALIKDLASVNQEKRIDVILINGDLLDKGGESLGTTGYEIFFEEFISPIAASLGMTKEQFLFIPGNHDINREFIDQENEFFLANKLTKELANETLKEMRTEFTKVNRRLERFKQFEQRLHQNDKNYIYSNNESLTIITENSDKVGFALINDSWRCSADLEKEQHFIGYNQLFNSKRYFQSEKTQINIAVIHHPLDAFNSVESEEIDNILKQYFDIAIFGHSHEHKLESVISSNGEILTIIGRSTFNDSDEKLSKFQPGYNILDLDIGKRTFEIQARKFIKTSGYRFDKDVESLKDGKLEGSLVKNNDYFKLGQTTTSADDALPSGYSADVNRIVKLLIGKSLYPNPYIFVRELIQNSVDACNRVKDKNTHLTPNIVVNINTDQQSFEISDEGDGMSKHILREHFSVIGKSISQEFNDSAGNFNLISKFGIGFISTFIIAQKVLITTKSVPDEEINFEIEDVFKGFTYNSNSAILKYPNDKTGTTIKVYLKKEYNATALTQFAKIYCRHIGNIKFYFNGVLQNFTESWNTENGVFNHTVKNSKYELRLTISNTSKFIFASNSGFFINANPLQIVPFKFPFIIGGEVNFTPNSIDFDISRSNIIETEKSKEIKREISISLRILFREALEGNDKTLKQTVISYLQYYLCLFDTNQTQMSESYADFYSKIEILNLCLEHCHFDYESVSQPLSLILQQLKSRGITKIYTSPIEAFSDYESLIVKYLKDKGNFILPPKNIVVGFRDGQQTVTVAQVITNISQAYGFTLVYINKISPTELTDMTMDKTQLPAKIQNQISSIEKERNLQIEIGKFNKTSKPVVRFQNRIIINFEHETIQTLLSEIDSYSDEIIKIYLLGFLGIRIGLTG